VLYALRPSWSVLTTPNSLHTASKFLLEPLASLPEQRADTRRIACAATAARQTDVAKLYPPPAESGLDPLGAE
jgi:hypothetical protein